MSERCDDCPYHLPAWAASCPLCPKHQTEQIVSEVTEGFRAGVKRILSPRTPTMSDKVTILPCDREAAAKAYSEFVGFAEAVDEGDWMARHFARHRIANSNPVTEALRETLEWIDYHKDDQDMSHGNFRVEAVSRARDALSAHPVDEGKE